MGSSSIHFLLVVLVTLLLGVVLLDNYCNCKLSAATAQDEEVYIVYMGGSFEKFGGERGSIVSSHVELLSSVLGSEEDAQLSLVYSYTHSFTGFSAVMSKRAAAAMAGKPGIISVFPDPVLKLHTTHSWDFLQAQSGVSAPPLNTASTVNSTSSDTIIGMLDTGVWPESPSFSDEGIGPVPSRWKGVCMGGQDFTCNRKIIGARCYKGSGMSARDIQGHGTHTASTAAGRVVGGADYYGLASGIARGGSPTSRIAVYKVCSQEGCLGSDILAGLDDAVNDGVDVISVSLGSASVFQLDFTNDPIAIGAFHATQKGVLVVCSAGNDGPDSYSVVNTAPWILTVAATTIDRDFQSDIVLGNGKVFKGEAINFSNLTLSEMHPVVFAGDVALNMSSREDASNCYPGSLDPQKAEGKIVVCSNSDGYSAISKRMKKSAVQSSKGRGMIVVDDLGKYVASNYGSFPSSAVTSESGAEILSYIKSTRNPVATILKTVAVTNYKPAPVVAYFSSRGPAALTQNILKPDISAPGVNILAAWIPSNQSGEVPSGSGVSHYYYAFESGTSMSCPHVSGTVAFLKSVNPWWSISAMRSALITTATWENNAGGYLTNDSNMMASPFEYGAGEMSPMRALKPGLVYDTTVQDYILFLCYLGYKESDISAIAGHGNRNSSSSSSSSYKCPLDSKEEMVSNINYPTIAIAKLSSSSSSSSSSSVTVTRTLTNVESSDAVYTYQVRVPAGLSVNVSPDKLLFSPTSTKLAFQVVFTASGSGSATKGYVFGSITWEDGTHIVRTPFVVNIFD